MAEVPKAPPMDNEVSEESNISTSQENGDGDRQVLAPAEGPRQDLINTAVKFLQNPKVQGSPLHQKKAFLTKKGLTQEEVNMAVESAGVTETAVSVAPSGVGPGMNQAGPPPPPHGFQPGMVVPYGPHQHPIPQYSRWARMRDLTLTGVVVASVTYAMYHLYKTYIEPLIRGKSAQEKRIDRLEVQIEEIHKSVNDSLAEISRTLAAIQLSVGNQSQQPATNQVIGRGITDLKADISSLRSLLLSKNQFPPPPSTSPMLPSWQLAGASSVGSQQTTPGSAANSSSSSTFTPSPAPSQPAPSEEAVSASSGNTDGEEGLSEKSVQELDTQQAATDRPDDGGDPDNQGLHNDTADTTEATESN